MRFVHVGVTMDNIIAGTIIVAGIVVVYFVVKKVKGGKLGEKLRSLVGRFKKEQ